MNKMQITSEAIIDLKETKAEMTSTDTQDTKHVMFSFFVAILEFHIRLSVFVLLGDINQ